jgi:CSLREA domain-containing protein
MHWKTIMKNTNILSNAALFLAVIILFGSSAQESRAASFTVNSTLDIPDFDAGDGSCQTINARQCTLRAAISEANALAGDDIIFLPAGIYITTRSTFGDDANAGGDFDITSNITINGANAASTFIQAASSAGTASERVLHFAAGTSTVNGVTIRYGRYIGNESGGGVYTGSNTNVALNEVTVSNNSTPLDGGGIYNLGALSLTNSVISDNSSRDGGGIYSTGTLTLTNSTVRGNSATEDGGGINNGISGMLTLTNTVVSNNTAFFEGGGIFNFGTMTLTNSTVSSNSAENSSGGGISSLSSGIITNSTVSNNQAGFRGGGISGGGMLTLTNSTMSDNFAPGNGGGGIFISGTANLNDTIIANSILGGDCIRNTGATINAQYSLIEGALLCVNGTNINNLTGDPLLGPLQNNGGPTLTHALLPGSPAIDKGNSFGLTTDQRGLTRPVDMSSISNASDGADMGAYEVQALAPTSASVSVSGRVLADGAGVYGAIVTMSDASGEIRSARTNPFGYYHFTDVRTGATYIFSVSSKRYSFSPQVVTIYEEMTDLNFTMGKYEAFKRSLCNFKKPYVILYSP